MDDRQICWVLAGPTASGKTALSLELARRHGCEIVCMDSMQIYRGMDIGTAKPTPEEQAVAPHHMIDVADPREGFSVSRYQELAEETVRQIHARGHRALFVGGTGFYLRALRSPMAMGEVRGDDSLRERLQLEADAPGGKETLHRRLAQVDPVTAARLHPNDVRRVIRALEVHAITGRPFSQQEQPAGEPAFRYRVAALDMDRALLYERVERRVDQMLAQGLAEEVRRLLDSGVPADCQAMKGLGYKELVPYLRGECTLQEATYAVKLGTRHYAKRQLTWFRHEPDILWVDPTKEDAVDRLERWYLYGKGNEEP